MAQLDERAALFWNDRNYERLMFFVRNIWQIIGAIFAVWFGLTFLWIWMETP